jgi:hypothetical protein
MNSLRTSDVSVHTTVPLRSFVCFWCGIFFVGRDSSPLRLLLEKHLQRKAEHFLKF